MNFLVGLFHLALFFVASIVSYLFVGPLSAFLCWLTMILYPAFSRNETEILQNKSHLTIDQMPVLRPVPHPMAGNKGFWKKLLVYLYVPRIWVLVQNWRWTYVEKDGTKVELVIPKGFECDAASIPRPFRAFFNPSGLLLLPALLHDYGFQYNQLWQVDENGFTRYLPPSFPDDSPRRRSRKQKKFWDELLFEAGMQVNDAWLINKFIWLIRGLSYQTWKKYRENPQAAPAPVAEIPGDKCLCRFNP